MDNTFTVINVVAAAINTLAVTFALFFSLRQTRFMRKSMEDTSKQTRANTIETSLSQYQDINIMLLQDEELRTATQQSKIDVYTETLLVSWEARFRLREEGITDFETWKADIGGFALLLWLEFIRSRWQGLKYEFHRDFQTFINVLINLVEQSQRNGTTREEFTSHLLTSTSNTPVLDPNKK